MNEDTIKEKYLAGLNEPFNLICENCRKTIESHKRAKRNIYAFCPECLERGKNEFQKPLANAPQQQS